MQRDDGADKRAFKYILIIVLPFCLLIGLENLSTAALILAVIFLMMFIGRVPLTQLGKFVGAGVILLILFIGSIYLLGSFESSDNGETQTEAIVNDEVKKDTKKKTTFLHRFSTWKGRIDTSSAPGPASPVQQSKTLSTDGHRGSQEAVPQAPLSQNPHVKLSCLPN